MSDRYILAPRADLDMEKILAYVATSRPRRAVKLISEFEKLFAVLGDSPLLGVERVELGAGVRTMPLYNFIVIYRPIETGVRILRVVHGARNLEGEDFYLEDY